MPRMDGLHVLEHLRADERTRLTPVVILTSSKEDQDLVKATSPGLTAMCASR